jgi:hypothetical protein
VGGHGGRQHEARQGRDTDQYLQASDEPGARLPAKRQADGTQGGDEPRGFARAWRRKLRQALGENAAGTGGPVPGTPFVSKCDDDPGSFGRALCTPR